jgi:hypothetical protein
MLHFTLFAPQPLFWVYERPITQVTLRGASGFELNHHHAIPIADEVDQIFGTQPHAILEPMTPAIEEDSCHYFAFLRSRQTRTPVKVVTHCLAPNDFHPLSERERLSAQLLAKGLARALGHLYTPLSPLMHQAACLAIDEGVTDLFLSLDAHCFELDPTAVELVQHVYGTPPSGEGRHDLCKLLGDLLGDGLRLALNNVIKQAEGASHTPILTRRIVYQGFWECGLNPPTPLKLDTRQLLPTLRLLACDLPHFLPKQAVARPLVETVFRHWHRLVHTALRLLGHVYQGSPKMQVALHWMTQRWDEAQDEMVQAIFDILDRQHHSELLSQHDHILHHWQH